MNIIIDGMAFCATVREMTTYVIFVWSMVDTWFDNGLEGGGTEVSNLFVHVSAGKIIGRVSMGERFELPYGEAVW